VAPLDKFSIVLTIIMGVVFLHEPLTAKLVIGGVLITAGTLVMVL
jgi:transporter family protein